MNNCCHMTNQMKEAVFTNPQKYDENARQEIEAHMRNCDVCANEYMVLRAEQAQWGE